MLPPQPMPTMLFFPFHLDSLLSSRGRRGNRAARKQQTGVSGRSLMAAATATGLLGLGSLYPLEAQAHRQHPCVTLKGTAVTKLTKMVGSKDTLRWQCLRIIENDSLEIIDLSKLTELTYLQIKGNKNLTKIIFPSKSNLKHLYIDNNDSNELESLNLSNLTRLTYLQIEGNKCLKKIILPNQSNLEYLHINNNDLLGSMEDIDFSSINRLVHLNMEGNDKLQKIRFENLARLTCLHIKHNKILKSISASNLTDSYCIKISDNDKLKSIDFSDLINVVHMKIENNKNLMTIKLPNFPGAGTSETVSLLSVPAMNSS